MKMREVIFRTLTRSERQCGSEEDQTPLVLQALARTDSWFLKDFLAEYSDQVFGYLATHGAILARGFAIHSVVEFEKVILSIHGMQGMSTVLMSDPGRIVVEGTEFVQYTDFFAKTGGSFPFGSFHHENYYTPDMPRFICFLCLHPSKIGGETGLVNTAKVYKDLPDPLKAKLEERSLFVGATPLLKIAERYNCQVAQVRNHLTSAGVEIVEGEFGAEAAFYKPSVIRHPITKEPSLIINISGELNSRGLAPLLLSAFQGDYSDWRWILHRHFWQHPLSYNLARYIFSSSFRRGVPPRFLLQMPKPTVLPSPIDKRRRRVRDLFAASDVEIIAQAIRRRYSGFHWTRGDMLIVDNLKLAHAGMPGFGHRELKVMLCNRVALPLTPSEPGIYAATGDNSTQCIGARIASES